jgi:hypothetical protein
MRATREREGHHPWRAVVHRWGRGIGFLLLLSTSLGSLGCEGGPIGERGRVEVLPHGEFFRTAEMDRPRYEHVAVELEDGTVIVAGGTDERLFTSIDTCEIFDQTLLVEPEPPSKSGGWLDTDFEGEQLRLNEGGRVYHTATKIEEGNVMVLGGAQDGIQGDVFDKAEIFDRSTRTWATVGASMVKPRFHCAVSAVSQGELLVFGGQIHMNVTVVDPNYPPSDPRFIREINTYPSVNSIEMFDSSLESEDGLGAFTLVTDEDDRPALLSGNQGRSIHAVVRLGGLDAAVGNAGDVYIMCGGIRTLSPVFAPQTKLRRMSQGSATLLNSLDIYDAFSRSTFLTPGVSLDKARAHGVMADTVGWHSDVTFDNIRGLSNVFLVAGGSDDVLPTMGVWQGEGFAATFTGFGPGAGISLVRTEPTDGDCIDVVVEDFLGAVGRQDLLDLVYSAGSIVSAMLLGESTEIMNPHLDYSYLEAGIEPDVQFWLGGVETFLASRMGKYFGMESYFNPMNQVALRPINRVHTEFVRLLRESATPEGLQQVGTLLCGGGGYLYVVPPGIQVQFYDEVPVSSVEIFDPSYNLVNAFMVPQRSPYDLFSVRTYWSIKSGQPLPVPGDEEEHPNPTGSEGAWLIADGFVPGNAFEGYEWIPPFTSHAGDYRIRFMERGRAWHTCSVVPGADGRFGTLDDRVLFAGGGNDVLAWGGEAVMPSALLFVPPANR